MPIFHTRKAWTRIEKIVFPLLPIHRWENEEKTKTYFYKKFFEEKILVGAVAKGEDLLCCPRREVKGDPMKEAFFKEYNRNDNN